MKIKPINNFHFSNATHLQQIFAHRKIKINKNWRIKLYYTTSKWYTNCRQLLKKYSSQPQIQHPIPTKCYQNLKVHVVEFLLPCNSRAVQVVFKSVFFIYFTNLNIHSPQSRFSIHLLLTADNRGDHLGFERVLWWPSEVEERQNSQFGRIWAVIWKQSTLIIAPPRRHDHSEEEPTRSCRCGCPSNSRFEGNHLHQNRQPWRRSGLEDEEINSDFIEEVV